MPSFQRGLPKRREYTATILVLSGSKLLLCKTKYKPSLTQKKIHFQPNKGNIQNSYFQVLHNEQ